MNEFIVVIVGSLQIFFNPTPKYFKSVVDKVAEPYYFHAVVNKDTTITYWIKEKRGKYE